MYFDFLFQVVLRLFHVSSYDKGSVLGPWVSLCLESLLSLEAPVLSYILFPLVFQPQTHAVAGEKSPALLCSFDVKITDFVVWNQFCLVSFLHSTLENFSFSM